jgi:hypothetical protein
VALTLRAVGGLTTREIADAFYVPEATMAQRIRPRQARPEGAPPGPAVAVGHVLGAATGLRETDRLREAIGERHKWHAVRGHLHELGGDLPATPRRTQMQPVGPRTSPSATTWSARPPAHGPPKSRVAGVRLDGL